MRLSKAVTSFWLITLLSSFNWQVTAGTNDFVSMVLQKGNPPLVPLNYSHIVDPNTSPVSGTLKLSGEIRLKVNVEQSYLTYIDKKQSVAEQGYTHLDRELLPDIKFQFFTLDGNVIPVERRLQSSSHAYWDYFVGVGLVEKTEQTGTYQLTVPLTLVERNQNCTHNGVLTFLIDKQGTASQYYYQFTSETCLYFKVNLWGVGQTKFATFNDIKAEPILEQLKIEQQTLLPRRPLTELLNYNNDVILDNIKLKEFIEHDMSQLGVVFKGIHYYGQCQTRTGKYPFCQQMVLPSYSLAKSVFAGLTSDALRSRHPNLLEEEVTDWITECSQNQWQGVRFKHLLNMTTGFYASEKHGVDEGSSDTLKFFLAESHQDKVKFACNHYPKKSSAGNKFIYHTSDTYLLGVALNRFYQHHYGHDKKLFDDFLVDKIFLPLGLSEIASSTLKTTDIGQAFTGYGLFFTADDLAKLSHYVSLQTADLIYKNIKHSMKTPLASIRYLNSFWLYDASVKVNCKRSTFIPYMSGYGGIALAIVSPELQFFYVSDSNHHAWQNSLIEFNKLTSICAN
ncbi:serine hydrolase [Thalassotalea eurytherma]|uniref:Beta-lactamase-related domain-containing protein n=1 Tax=Thalassotalea eurytherma TaxID=1144278 RepID=A0ABQ6H3Q7_9GAMM|nr:serine hydrolase domain-containing protein [Thalassotalea eurytherma]GLX81452.1 hypothetical protein theurythT_09040 [Thalassotalea eurytherma]